MLEAVLANGVRKLFGTAGKQVEQRGVISLGELQDLFIKNYRSPQGEPLTNFAEQAAERAKEIVITPGDGLRKRILKKMARAAVLGNGRTLVRHDINGHVLSGVLPTPHGEVIARVYEVVFNTMAKGKQVDFEKLYKSKSFQFQLKQLSQAFGYADEVAKKVGKKPTSINATQDAVKITGDKSNLIQKLRQHYQALQKEIQGFQKFKNIPIPDKEELRLHFDLAQDYFKMYKEQGIKMPGEFSPYAGFFEPLFNRLQGQKVQ